ncbi:MAG: hypothetical protein U0936_23050 [Planctomycetaceae bacterium]
MTWFRQLTGFDETSPQAVREMIQLRGSQLVSLVNNSSYTFGCLEIPTLAELRERIRDTQAAPSKIRVREVVADVQNLHRDTVNTGALFQVASQFNLLEMVGPERTPEDGIGIYELDRTQGPACAIACGAGTIYRNYFVPVNGQTGQTTTNQIDCLADIGELLGNQECRLWQMENGYALPSQAGLAEVSQRLLSSNEQQLDELRSLLRIGVQWDTQVTLSNCQHFVTQAYCSAMPVSYTGHSSSAWKPFAKFVLEAAYEATLCAGILNARATGNRTVFLTLLGGGAFGNMTEWISDAIRHALSVHRHADLDVAVVSHGTSREFVRALAKEQSRNKLPS